MRSITLNDGTKLEYKELTWQREAEIVDDTQHYNSMGIGAPFQLYTKLLIYCQICTRKELEDRKYNRQQIMEIGEKLLSSLFDDIIIKKK